MNVVHLTSPSPPTRLLFSAHRYTWSRLHCRLSMCWIETLELIIVIQSCDINIVSSTAHWWRWFCSLPIGSWGLGYYCKGSWHHLNQAQRAQFCTFLVHIAIMLMPPGEGRGVLLGDGHCHRRAAAVFHGEGCKALRCELLNCIVARTFLHVLRFPRKI